MDSKNENLELINVAIKKLIEERKNREISCDSFIEDEDDDGQLLLSKLLSQLESLKKDGTVEKKEVEEEVNPRINKSESKSENGDVKDGTVEKNEVEEEVNPRIDKSESKSENGDVDINAVDAEEIVKELKKVKKQNSITHWLLSAMIVLTLAWQVSEISLILKVRDGLSHPFRSLGGMFTGMWKTPTTNGHDSENEASSMASIKVPDLPHMEFPDLNGNDGGKD